jgi:hypothetical protein
MDRRDLLRAVGAAAAFTMLPRTAEAAWASLAAAPHAGLQVLSAADAATLGALADTWFPRTDTPSATDVGVVAWIDVVVNEYYSDAERKQFNDGLAAIDALVQSGAVPMPANSPAYSPASNAALFDVLEKKPRSDMAARGYWRLKGLVVHGYFTSERVQKEVLKNEIMPGRYVGDAPHIVSTR